MLTRQEFIRALASDGYGPAICQGLADLTGSHRHAWRVAETLGALGIPMSQRKKGELALGISFDRVRLAIACLDIDLSRRKTQRSPWAKHLGKGRWLATDGAAWRAAAEEARLILIKEVNSRIMHPYYLIGIDQISEEDWAAIYSDDYADEFGIVIDAGAVDGLCCQFAWAIRPLPDHLNISIPDIVDLAFSVNPALAKSPRYSVSWGDHTRGCYSREGVDYLAGRIPADPEIIDNAEEDPVCRIYEVEDKDCNIYKV